MKQFRRASGFGLWAAMAMLVWASAARGEDAASPPDSGQARWRIPLRPAAHGLFIEGSGRLLLLEEGGRADPDRLLDLGTDRPALPAGHDPTSALFLALAQRPDASTTAVVDLTVIVEVDVGYRETEAIAFPGTVAPVDVRAWAYPDDGGREAVTVLRTFPLEVAWPREVKGWLALEARGVAPEFTRVDARGAAATCASRSQRYWYRRC